MKALKQIRLVYRQHLLPPLVLPFERILEYSKIIQNTQVPSEAKHSQEQLQRIIQIHQTVMAQLIKIRNRYISPLKECPFYYQSLDQKVRKGLLTGQFASKDYLQAISSITAEERIKLHQNIYNHYIAFKKKIEAEDPTFYSNVTYIPVLKYQSPQDLTVSLKKDWKDLTNIQKIDIMEKYEQKLDKYWTSMGKIARSSSLSMEELLQLIKNQINPPLSGGLKSLLFA